MFFFRRRGQEPESWYAPRRHDLRSGFAIISGVGGAFYAGATQWSLLSDPEFSFAWSFAKYQGAIVLGAAVFAFAGGSLGWAIGWVWERWHRKRRALRQEPASTQAPAVIQTPNSKPQTPSVQTSASYDSIPRFGELYDAIPLYQQRKDVDFYVDTAKLTGGAVLELGCGTGRVLLPIARAGIRIVGVDGSRLMLDRCRERLNAEPRDVRERVSLHLEDAARLNLGEKFPLIIAPFRVFQQITTVDHQLAFLAAAARHLAPGGWLVFDLFNPNYSLLAADRTREAPDTPETTMPDGRTLRRTFRIPRVRWVDQVSETELIYYVAEPGQDAKRYVQAFEMRWYTRSELEHLMARVGLSATIYGGFDRSMLTEASPDMVIRAELSAGNGRSANIAAGP